MQEQRKKALGILPCVICSTAGVKDSRRNCLFTFICTVTEKLENRNKFQRRGKLCLYNTHSASRWDFIGLVTENVTMYTKVW